MRASIFTLIATALFFAIATFAAPLETRRDAIQISTKTCSLSQGGKTVQYTVFISEHYQCPASCDHVINAIDNISILRHECVKDAIGQTKLELEVVERESYDIDNFSSGLYEHGAAIFVHKSASGDQEVKLNLRSTTPHSPSPNEQSCVAQDRADGEVTYTIDIGVNPDPGQRCTDVAVGLANKLPVRQWTGI